MASSQSSTTTAVTASCACGTFHLPLSIPTSSLPYPRALCLCSSCRSVSGSCGLSFLPIPSTHKIDPTVFSLTAYTTSDCVVRYFCSTCGAHTVVDIKDRGLWALATGLLERTEGVLEWTGCKWVKDTLDGGVSVWLSAIMNPAAGPKQQRALQRWMLQDGKDGDIVPADALRKYTPSHREEGEEGERLKAQCHCGGVRFYITRPNAASKTARSTFPDLMVPYHSSSNANPENKTWWLRAGDTKYLAGTCTCKSCRLALGFEIQPWAFVPKCNIVKENGQEMDYNMGTLKTYASSPGVSREFCSVCGATVFWRCEGRPDLVDVSVGLLDPAEGARVEGWLDWWTGRVSFEELAVSRSLVGALEEGLKTWASE